MRNKAITEDDVHRFLQMRRVFEERAGEVVSIHRDYIIGSAERVEFDTVLREVTAYWYVQHGRSYSSEEDCETFPMEDLWATDDEIIQKIEDAAAIERERAAKEDEIRLRQREATERAVFETLAKKFGYPLSPS